MPITPVAEVVVEARRPVSGVEVRPNGTVFWRLRRGEAEVWVLGVLPFTPQGLRFSTRRLDALMSLADVVLLPPVDRLDGQASSVQLPKATELGDVIGPPLMAQVRCTALQAGLSADALRRDRPFWAGYRLLGAASVHASLGSVADEVGRRAIFAGHPVRRLGVRTGSLSTMAAMDSSLSTRCLQSALDDIGFLQANVAAASRAWAVGDLPTVRDHYRDLRFVDCIKDAPVTSDLAAARAQDLADAIEAQLTRPGRRVAVVLLGDLVRRDGALDRLRTAGAEVTVPVGDG